MQAVGAVLRLWLQFSVVCQCFTPQSRCELPTPQAVCLRWETTAWAAYRTSGIGVLSEYKISCACAHEDAWF